jgi:hypothetical protein
VLHLDDVRLLGIIHMDADLLDGVDDVGVGERQVLEGLSEALELSRISNGRLRSVGDLGLCVHRHRDRLAVHYASALKDIESKLVLWFMTMI